ncbi:hypothetical protein DWF00_17070 [Bosea caraganae]|uniref:Uncharacterized protein n=1 Tax=Bosea caraganae TaxID=2763117 RepID=A0A370L7B6_9HYPH|nr:hypothetical protein [Bosea caraganae]RDJ24926.1 hypothetical protein DWF00_17070 [Bosea caraganae]RDJ26038.1 hypothetical protein DWE98_09290 [Bosea caraganae]
MPLSDLHPALQLIHDVLDFTIYDVKVTERAPVKRAAVQEPYGSVENTSVQRPSAEGDRDADVVQPSAQSVASVRCQPFAIGDAFFELGSEFIVAELGEIATKIKAKSQAALRYFGWGLK